MEAPQLSFLKIGEKVYVSSKTVLDKKGVPWHKIKIENSGYGYIQAKYVTLQGSVEELRAAGIETNSYIVSDIDLDPWNYTARIAGMFGGEFTSGIYEFSAEGEFAYRMPLADLGFFQKFLSLGLAFMMFDNRQPVFLVSTVLRPTLKKPLIPGFNLEFRIRVGGSTSSPLLLLGGSAGLSYPLSKKRNKYYTASFEIGTLEKLGVNFYHFWGSAGLGYHF